MKVLNRMLLARCGTRPAGHWVVMETVIFDVPIMVMACAWSQRGVSHVASTAGSMEFHDEKHVSSFENNFGNVVMKEINKPKIIHVLHECLPLIEEHNK